MLLPVDRQLRLRLLATEFFLTAAAGAGASLDDSPPSSTLTRVSSISDPMPQRPRRLKTEVAMLAWVFWGKAKVSRTAKIFEGKVSRTRSIRSVRASRDGLINK